MSLKKHILVHGDAKPFCCDTCSKNFATKKDLEEHKNRVHKNLRTMRAHRRTHMGEDKTVKEESPEEEQDDENMEQDDDESQEEEPEKKVVKEEAAAGTRLRKARVPKDDLQSFIIQLTEGDDNEVVLKSI